MIEVGEIAYEAYRRSCGGKSVRGDELPDWENLPYSIRIHWEAAGHAVADAVTGGE